MEAETVISPVTGRRVGFTKANSNTGFVGISLSSVERRHRVFPCVVATWRSAKNQPKTVRVRYGDLRSEAEAIRMACERRARGLEERIKEEKGATTA